MKLKYAIIELYTGDVYGLYYNLRSAQDELDTLVSNSDGDYVIFKRYFAEES